MTLPQELDHTFSGPIGVDVRGDIWPCVNMPNSVEFFGTGKSVRVDYEIDGLEMVNKGLMPNGAGGHMVSLSKKVLKDLGKGIGDEVTIRLTRRHT